MTEAVPILIDKPVLSGPSDPRCDLNTGLRAGELANLQPEDIDFLSQCIQVRHGKGNKQRGVRIGNEAGQTLQHYLEHLRGTEPGPLFLTCRGQPLCRSAMRTIFQRLGKHASIPKVHPRRFRHTFVTWAIELHARQIDVQFLLGHSTAAMLRRYTATYDAEKAAQAHALFSPADRLNGRPHDSGNRSRKTPVSPALSRSFPEVLESTALAIRLCQRSRRCLISP